MSAARQVSGSVRNLELIVLADGYRRHTDTFLAR
jgi:hypothetical protein